MNMLAMGMSNNPASVMRRVNSTMKSFTTRAVICRFHKYMGAGTVGFHVHGAIFRVKDG